jgi:hypothetical protein
MLTRLMLIAAIVSVLAAAGCSGGDSSTEASDGAETSESDVIVLEDGWAIQDVITPEEVGEIVGATMAYFPEAGSAAQDGRPEAGYTQEGVEYSKVYFTVDVDGGEEELEIIKGYAVEGSLEEIPGLGDQAYALEYEDGEVGVILVRGDAFIRIDWPPDVYGSDAAGLGTELANLLMSKMYE